MKHAIVFSLGLLLLGCSSKPPSAPVSTPMNPTASASPAGTASPTAQAAESGPRLRPALPEAFFASLTPVREFTEQEASAEPWFQRGMSESRLALYTSKQGMEELARSLLPSLKAEDRENYWQGEDWHEVDGCWIGAYAKPGDIWGALVILTPLPEEGKAFENPLYDTLKLPRAEKLPPGPGCLVVAATAYELPPLFAETWPKQP